MSRDGALARARALRDELVKRGVPTSIEIQQGRPGTPNGRWYDTRFIGSMGHHIVSRRSQGSTPGLALIKRGRSDVPGPLCNGYLGFDGRARIICMGWANHPGAGGPYTLPGGTIPRDVGRPYLFGWEIEGGLVESDWTPAFRVLMGKCHAATLAWLKRDERSHIEHKTWAPTRKIDRLNYTLTKARNELKPYLTATGDWFDMATKKDLQEVIEANNNNSANRTWREKIDNPLNPKEPLFAETYLRFAWRDNKWIMNNQAKQLGELAAIRKAVKADPVNEAALAQQIAPLILPAIMEQIEGVSDERIEAALERVIRETFGSLAADGEEA